MPKSSSPFASSSVSARASLPSNPPSVQEAQFNAQSMTSRTPTAPPQDNGIENIPQNYRRSGISQRSDGRSSQLIFQLPNSSILLSRYIEDRLCVSLALFHIDNTCFLSNAWFNPKSRYRRSAKEVERGLNQLFRIDDLHSVLALKFHLFSRLATELRLEIWQCALMSRGRVMQVKLVKEQSHWLHGNKPLGLTGYRAVNSTPTLLHVCKESRQEALRFYELSLERLDGTSTSYLDPYFDILWFRHDSMSASDIVTFFNGAYKNTGKICSIFLCKDLCKALINGGLGDIKRNFAGLKTIFCCKHFDSQKVTCTCETKECLSDTQKQRLESILGGKITLASIEMVGPERLSLM